MTGHTFRVLRAVYYIRKYGMRAGAGKSGRDASIGKQAESAVKYNIKVDYEKLQNKNREALFFPKFTIRQALSIFLWPGKSCRMPHVKTYFSESHVVASSPRVGARVRPQDVPVSPSLPRGAGRPAVPATISLCLCVLSFFRFDLSGGECRQHPAHHSTTAKPPRQMHFWR